MGTSYVPEDVGSGVQTQTTLNDNFTNIQTALAASLSREGTSPNSMAADIDMDSNDILNAGTIAADDITINGVSGIEQGVITAAMEWAIKTDGLVSEVDYSSKEYAIGTVVPAGSSKDWSITPEDTLVDGVDFSSLHHAAKASTSATNAATSETNADVSETNAAASAAAALAHEFTQVPTRNAVMNQDPVSQGTSTRTGMDSVLGLTASAVDQSTGDLGGLRWYKDRNNVQSHILADTVRGDFYLSSDTTAAEVATVPAVTADDVTWSFQTNQKITGTTNRNKAYTAHYNADMGFSIVGYEGDGVDGHEIPHHLGVEPELSIFKDRDTATTWVVQGAHIGDASNSDFLALNLTNALANSAGLKLLPNPSTLSIGSNAAINPSTKNTISYHFASVPGVSKVGKYIGTGAAGNYVACGFKAGWVLIKNMTTATDWVLHDVARGSSEELEPNTSDAAATRSLDFVDTGITITSTGSAINTLNDEYLFLAFADSGSGPTTYSYPTTDDVLTINQDSLISFADGFDLNGQIDTQELVGAGITHTLGTGHENKHYWLYKDKAGSYGQSEFRPLEGVTRDDADKWGVVSPVDSTLRTTAKHFDYESATGVALASGETSTFEAYKAFDKDTNNLSTSKWRIASTTTSTLQYKQDEARILKSWRMRASDDADTIPRQFTIEGSDDGFTWAAIDSTYTASDFTDPGVGLWSDIQGTSGNTTAYLYHRINTTLNHGDATNTDITELEFNTILPSDYYLVNEGVMYNSSDTAIERVYLAEVRTGGTGDITYLRNLPVAKAKGEDAEFQGDVTVHGELLNHGVAIAQCSFDGTQNPPLILASANILDIVDGGTGLYYAIVSDNVDVDACVILTNSNVNHTQGRPDTGQRIRVSTANNSHAAVDASYISFALYHGKEIK